MDKVIIDKVDVSGCEHYRAEIETKMPYGEYEILKDKCHYSGIEIIQDCKGNKDCIYKQLKRLKEEKGGMQILIDNYIALTEKYHQALQEIRDILAERIEWTGIPNNAEIDIIDKINEVIGAEE